MDPIESVEHNGVDDHGWKKVVSRKKHHRKQKPADKSNGANGNENLKAEETEKRPDWEVSLAKAAAKIRPSDLADHFANVPVPFINNKTPNGDVFANRPNNKVFMGQLQSKPTKKIWLQRSSSNSKPPAPVPALKDKIRDKEEVVPPQVCTEKLIRTSNRFTALDDNCTA